jgi:pilus assembly protein Flp/PilA
MQIELKACSLFPGKDGGTTVRRRFVMQVKFSNFYAKMQTLIMREDGQDLIEYALVVALIAFAATAGMNSVASSINTAFANLGTTLNTYTS